MDLATTLEALSPRVLRYALATAGDRDVAEDAAQEALTALVQRWRRIGPPESPEAFVFAVARRRAGRRLFARGRLRSLTVLRHRANGHDPEADAVHSQTLERLAEALRELPAGEAETVRLMVLGELSVRETARVLGIGESAVKMRVSRGRAKLAAALEDDR